jgi:hypothetical protein
MHLQKAGNKHSNGDTHPDTMKKIASFFLALLILCPASFAVGASEIFISLSPDIVALTCEYIIEAKLDEALTENAKINVSFPEAVKLPSQISDGLVTISEIPVSGVLVEGSLISFTLPEPQPDRKNLLIKFPLSIGIINPFNSGSYQITVSVDDLSLTGAFNVKPILPQAPLVVIKPDKVGNKVGITIQIPHPKELVINAGDLVKVDFPQEFMLPEVLEPDFVNISGNKIAAGSIQNQSISLVFSENASDEKPLTIAFEPNFGIKSPLWPGEFTLVLAIEGKLEPIHTGTFQILPLSPTLSISLNPPLADDKWYDESPEIEISSKAQREIFYFWDNGKRLPYKEKFKAEDGMHVLGFVGKVKNGGWEAVSYRTIRVDMNPPAFEKIHKFYNTEKLELVYSVDDKSPCKSGVGDVESENLEGNRFLVHLLLKPGPNEFVFWAKDTLDRLVEIRETLILDKTPPPLVISKPVALATICGKEIVVTGKTEPGCIVTVNGITIQVSQTGEFKVATVLQKEGSAEILVTSTDLAGNTQMKTIPIVYITSAIITCQIGSKSVDLAGFPSELEAEPFENEGVAFIPLQTIADILGYDLDAKATTLADRHGKKNITFSTTSKKIIIREGEGKNLELELSAPPQISNNIIFVPMDFFDKAFGNKVTKEENTIKIYFCPRG